MLITGRSLVSLLSFNRLVVNHRKLRARSVGVSRLFDPFLVKARNGRGAAGLGQPQVRGLVPPLPGRPGPLRRRDATRVCRADIRYIISSRALSSAPLPASGAYEDHGPDDLGDVDTDRSVAGLTPLQGRPSRRRSGRGFGPKNRAKLPGSGPSGSHFATVPHGPNRRALPP